MSKFLRKIQHLISFPKTLGTRLSKFPSLETGVYNLKAFRDDVLATLVA